MALSGGICIGIDTALNGQDSGTHKGIRNLLRKDAVMKGQRQSIGTVCSL